MMCWHLPLRVCAVADCRQVAQGSRKSRYFNYFYVLLGLTYSFTNAQCVQHYIHDASNKDALVATLKLKTPL